MNNTSIQSSGEDLRILTGGNGTVMVTPGSPLSNVNILFLVTESECVFLSILDEDGVDQVISYSAGGLGIAAYPCGVGDKSVIIKARGSKRIKSVQLTSGSCWAILA